MAGLPRLGRHRPLSLPRAGPGWGAGRGSVPTEDAVVSNDPGPVPVPLLTSLSAFSPAAFARESLFVSIFL